MKTNILGVRPLMDSEKLSQLQHGHCVQFYTSTNELIKPLGKFITLALQNKRSFIVIATHEHLQAINDVLILEGLNVDQVTSTGQYIALDALQTLDKFMVNGLPDKDLFNKVIGTKISSALKQGKPVHAYGEMVAVLWKQGNKEAVLQLEELWNKLLAVQSVSLYCAYPALHFTTYSDVLEQIRSCHSFDFTRLVTK